MILPPAKSQDKPKLTTSQLVDKYAQIAQDIYDFKKAGDYTFVGLFGAFLTEWLDNYDDQGQTEVDPNG